MRIAAYFYGYPGGPMDKAARSIFEARGGQSIGAGTVMAGPAAGERDIVYDVPDDCADECREALKRSGFRLTPTPMWDSV
jgi:hypothetical protein